MHISTRAALKAATGLSSPIPTVDEFMTYDQATVDSTGAFLISELDRLDNRPYEPLVSISWSRDIDLRTDVTVADETSSFLNSNIAAPGGIRSNGKNWISKEATAIPGVDLDIGRTINLLNLWGVELKFTLPELATAAKLQRPIDKDKYDALQLKYQMDIDEQVYIGDTDYNVAGLTNNTNITPISVLTGVNGTTWSVKSPAEILADINLLATTVWTQTGYAFAPTHCLIPPVQFGYLTAELISTAGSQNILEVLAENSLSYQLNGQPLRIFPSKWLPGRGAWRAQPDDHVRKQQDMVRFPLTTLQRTPVEYRSLWQITTYWGKLGQVEFPRLESLGYMDGL